MKALIPLGEFSWVDNYLHHLSNGYIRNLAIALYAVQI